jgi:hypothetical protein
VADLSGAGLAKVSKYRAYVIGEDGHFVSCRTFACDNDADAMVWAKQLVDGHDVELWSGYRFVIRIEHHGYGCVFSSGPMRGSHVQH